MPDLVGVGVEVGPVTGLLGVGVVVSGPGDLVELASTVVSSEIAFDGGGPALGTLGAGDQIVLGSDAALGDTSASQNVDITP